MIKIITFNKNKKIIWNDNWIYIGSNYVNVVNCEYNISDKRISLSPYLEKNFEELKPLFFDWIEKQRKANNDQLEWWMNHIAGKNNAGSAFFSHVLQIYTLKKLLDTDCLDKNNLLIICEDIFIENSIKHNLENKYNLCSNNFIRGFLLKLYYLAYFLSRSIFIIISEIYKFTIIFIFFRNKKNIDKVDHDEVFLIHQCLERNSFLNKNLECRYFNELPKWLEERGKVVYRIPWLYNVDLPIKKIYKKIRDYNCFVYHDFISYYDFLSVLTKSVFSYKRLKYDILFKNLIIYDLLLRERLIQLGNGPSFVNFWCYYKALKIFSRNVKSIKIYSVFEMMVHEHVQNTFVNKSKNSKFISYGYYHSLISKDFLAYYFSKGDLNSIVFPNYIVTNGKLSKDILVKRGIPKKKVIDGPSLRQRIPKYIIKSKKNNKNNLLLVLSLSISHSIEMINHINSLYNNKLKQLGINIKIKTHPMQNKNKILKVFGWSKLPNYFSWEDKELSVCLIDVKAAITSGTGSVFDILLAEVVPIPLKPELDLPWNYLDTIDTKKLFKPVLKEELGSTIIDIFKEKNPNTKNNIDKLNKKIRKGIGRVDNQSLEKFLKLN